MKIVDHMNNVTFNLPALAGTRRACRAGERVICACIFARYVSLEILWDSKDKNFLGHF